MAGVVTGLGLGVGGGRRRHKKGQRTGSMPLTCPDASAQPCNEKHFCGLFSCFFPPYLHLSACPFAARSPDGRAPASAACRKPLPRLVLCTLALYCTCFAPAGDSKLQRMGEKLCADLPKYFEGIEVGMRSWGPGRAVRCPPCKCSGDGAVFCQCSCPPLCPCPPRRVFSNLPFGGLCILSLHGPRCVPACCMATCGAATSVPWAASPPSSTPPPTTATTRRSSA